jgi:hypothetical protein
MQNGAAAAAVSGAESRLSAISDFWFLISDLLRAAAWRKNLVSKYSAKNRGTIRVW